MAWEHIQKSVDWIEQHIDKKIDIRTLSNNVYLSPFYFQRLFKYFVGKTVIEYVKSRRVARAAEYIKCSDKTICEISQIFGYENHETFTRAFKEIYDITPTKYRTHEYTLIHCSVPDLSVQKYFVELNEPIVYDGIVLYMKQKKLQSPRHFNKEDTLFPNRVNIEHEIESVYKPEHFTGCTIPLGEYVVCYIESENLEKLEEALIKAKDYINRNWLLKNDINIDRQPMEIFNNHLPHMACIEIYYKILNIIKKEDNYGVQREKRN